MATSKTNPFQIQNAKNSISRYIHATPLEKSLALSKQFNSEIYLKLENWQTTGSFKVRGALNKMLSLSEEEKQRGVITASAGNHALGVAYAAKLLGISGKIVVPENASPAKMAALQNYGLELIKSGADYDDSEAIAWDIQKKDKLTFVHAFSDPETIAGQGTIALEILESLPDTKQIVVPVGGGGLISGVAIAAKAINPKIKIIGVQSEASPAMHAALAADKVIETPIFDTIADGLAGRFVAGETLEFVKKYVDDVVLIQESSIVKAIQVIFEAEHFIVEASAAVGIAAMLDNQIKSTQNTVFILTGRNISKLLLQTIFAP